MKITVRVKPNARQEKVEETGNGILSVWVREKPREGKATQAVIQLLSKYLDVPKSDIALIRGQTAREKVFEVKR